MLVVSTLKAEISVAEAVRTKGLAVAEIGPNGAQEAAGPLLRTTPFERFLLLTSIVILPLQDHIPSVAGMSVMSLIFALLAGYIIVNRPSSLGKIWYHPIFITAYAFIGVAALLEFSSPLSSYGEIVRFTQMIGGAVCVAALCRDRSALNAGLYGHIAAAVWVSVVLFFTSYGTLQGMQADDFSQASKVRAQAFEANPIENNINAMAFTCTQGGIVAVALALVGRVKQHRILFLGIASFCFVASFIAMSRGAALITFMSFAVILYAHGVRHGKALIVVAILGLSLYAVVPDAVWSRMTYSSETTRDGKMESRARIYTTVLNRLPEYVVAGVGAGNFRMAWGASNGFAPGTPGGAAAGAHNSFLQIAIYWGSLGLLTFLWICWCVYRSIPLRSGRDELSLGLLGIIASLGLWLFVMHGFYNKQYAFGLGLLVGARHWIWPMGIVWALEANQGPSRHRV